MFQKVKGNTGKWRWQLKLFGKYFIISNWPVKFQGKHNVMLGEGKSQRLKLQLIMERGFKCECCRRSGEDVLLEVHHITPVAVNPELSADLSNLKLLCKRCHKQIHDVAHQSTNNYSQV